MSGEWSKDLTTKFIEIYRENPCLWQIKHSSYTNRNLKQKAYEELIHLIKPSFPDANEKFVKSKIQNIRGAFRKEKKKVDHDMKSSSGAAAETLYEPSLW